jgi:hypothetical protein
MNIPRRGHIVNLIALACVWEERLEVKDGDVLTTAIAVHNRMPALLFFVKGRCLEKIFPGAGQIDIMTRNRGDFTCLWRGVYRRK